MAAQLLAYDEDTAGGLMQKEFISVEDSLRASEVVAHLREHADEYADHPASYIYITKADGRPSGVLSMRELVLCEADKRIAGIASERPLTVPVGMSGQDIVKLFKRYEYTALPVVDDADHLIGVVTHEAVLHFAEEEADEELLKFGGIVGGEELRTMALSFRLSRRLAWLVLSTCLAMVAASVIAMYEGIIHEVIALAVFLPVLAAISGCSGSQSIAVSIRELSLERVKPGDFLWVLGKELSVGLVNGLVLGVLIGSAAWVWKGNAVLGLILGASLWISTLFAVCVGGMVPLLLRKFGKDPALASGLILTTLVDLGGFLLVLSLAYRYRAMLII